MPGAAPGLRRTSRSKPAPRPGDAVVERDGIRFFLPAESRLLLDGVTIDFAETATTSGFLFHNPNAANGGCKANDAVDPAIAAFANSMAH